MTNALRLSIAQGFQYLYANNTDVPTELLIKARLHGVAVKAGISDMASINAAYHDAITQALTGYFEGGSASTSRNQFKRATTIAFGDAMDAGTVAGGGELPFTGDALDWFNARLEQEFGNIASVFVQAKEIKKEGGDFFTWVSARADGYTRTVQDIYDRARLYAAKNKMLTFDGPDGSPDNICQKNNGTCVKLKGQRHKASWWIAHDLVPYRGNQNYDCGAWECRHFLRDDQGNKFTN